MKNKEDEWTRLPDMVPIPGPGGPMSLEEPQDQEDEPISFQAVRRIELIARLHHMAFATTLEMGGLPPAQAGALKTIIRNPGMSQRELADALHIQRATTTVMLQKMERAGFIDRRPDPEDQRISRIYPTEAAKKLDTENHQAFLAYFARCFENFSDEEIIALQSSLEKLRDNLRGILSEAPPSLEKE